MREQCTPCTNVTGGNPRAYPRGRKLLCACARVTLSRATHAHTRAFDTGVLHATNRDVQTTAPLTASEVCSYNTDECIRDDLRTPEVQNFHGGACPQTPLAGALPRANRTSTPLPSILDPPLGSALLYVHGVHKSALPPCTYIRRAHARACWVCTRECTAIASALMCCIVNVGGKGHGLKDNRS